MRCSKCGGECIHMGYFYCPTNDGQKEIDTYMCKDCGHEFKDYMRLYAVEIGHQIHMHVEANNYCVEKNDKHQYEIHSAEVDRLSKLYDNYCADRIKEMNKKRV